MLFDKQRLVLLVLAFMSSFPALTLGSNSPTKDELFNLAVKEAKRMGLASEPEAKAEIDKVLYKHYLRSVLGQHADELKPTDKELRKAYASAPRVRLRHLAVMGKAEVQKRK
ncbi:MAG: hypothetical protein R3B54_17910 [Bdellovibrionota bacterium]